MKSVIYKKFRGLVKVASKKEFSELLSKKAFFVNSKTGGSLSVNDVDSSFGQLASVMVIDFPEPVEINDGLTSLSIMLGKFDMVHRNIPAEINSYAVTTHYYFSPDRNIVRKFVRLPNSLSDTRQKIDSDKKGSLYKDEFGEEDERLLVEIIKEVERRLV